MQGELGAVRVPTTQQTAQALEGHPWPLEPPTREGLSPRGAASLATAPSWHCVEGVGISPERGSWAGTCAEGFGACFSVQAEVSRGVAL